MSALNCSLCHRTLSGQREKERNGRAYWQRRFPDVVLCKECWMTPDEISDQLKRDSVAKIIWRARQQSREQARAAMQSLRGTGIPVNPHRKRRKHDRAV